MSSQQITSVECKFASERYYVFVHFDTHRPLFITKGACSIHYWAGGRDPQQVTVSRTTIVVMRFHIVCQTSKKRIELDVADKTGAERLLLVTKLAASILAATDNQRQGIASNIWDAARYLYRLQPKEAPVCFPLSQYMPTRTPTPTPATSITSTLDSYGSQNSIKDSVSKPSKVWPRDNSRGIAYGMTRESVDGQPTGATQMMWTSEERRSFSSKQDIESRPFQGKSAWSLWSWFSCCCTRDEE